MTHHTKPVLSRLAAVVADSELLARPLIWAFRRGFGIRLEEAAEPDPRAYKTLSAFFTRALRADARPMPADMNALACPADGRLMSFGRLDRERLVEAKGQDYSVRRLLGDAASAERVQGGFHACVYLSPSDYHRVHMPCAGRLASWTSIPGTLFSVSPATAARIPDLHCRNERLVCRFETVQGFLAVVFIGARMVGGIETTFNSPSMSCHGDDAGDGVRFAEARGPEYVRGDELGRFRFGSTVVLCWQAEGFAFAPGLEAGMCIKVGEALGSY